MGWLWLALAIGGALSTLVEHIYRKGEVLQPLGFGFGRIQFNADLGTLISSLATAIQYWVFMSVPAAAARLSAGFVLPRARTLRYAA